jgi:hypothetical protein
MLDILNDHFDHYSLIPYSYDTFKSLYIISSLFLYIFSMFCMFEHLAILLSLEHMGIRRVDKLIEATKVVVMIVLTIL